MLLFKQCWNVNPKVLTFLEVGFGVNLVQGFRVYAWRAVPSFPQIELCVPSFALRPQPLYYKLNSPAPEIANAPFQKKKKKINHPKCLWSSKHTYWVDFKNWDQQQGRGEEQFEEAGFSCSIQHYNVRHGQINALVIGTRRKFSSLSYVRANNISKRRWREGWPWVLGGCSS